MNATMTWAMYKTNVILVKFTISHNQQMSGTQQYKQTLACAEAKYK